jgi:formate/nitrite transporter FocA (FNT family)
MSASNDRVLIDVPRRSYGEILGEEIHEGTAEVERHGLGLFLSGVSAGIDITFSVLLMAVTLTLANGVLGPLFERALLANMYAVGFIFVKLGRSELFTEHTTLLVFPALHRKLSLGELARVWAYVYSGNLVGVAVLSAILAVFAPYFGIIQPQAFGQIATHLVDYPGWIILISAILAGWMMGLLSWLTAATHETMSQILCIWLVAAAIGFAGLHHAIAGSAEVLSGVFSGQGASLAGFFHFLVWTTLGNALGGLFFAVLKYAHAIHGQQSEPSGEPR